ncbi:Uncharacterised protein [Streptococcus pyogenes]|uniref:hypothetical protein n=1 Tax=Streptococcus pyogenes TaxID=1314 RepID=UPI0010A1F751|nr:hypothetical protein [Streptococcus pyogenes]VHF16388.1 Uncharacterised protein [Streptococcus pyogenes]
MKTKSKRFLNLATLCLALLGTTLLMAHPVKAEVQVIRQEQRSDTETSENQTDDTEMNKYLEGRKKGYGDGYSDGYQLGYSQGWHQTNHPIQAALESALNWLWDFFSSFFPAGSEQS